MAKTKRLASRGIKSGKVATRGRNSKLKKRPVRLRYLPQLCTELEKASSGLFHISESDSPYAFFTLRQRNMRLEADKLSVIEFISGIGLSEELINEFKISLDQLVEERSLDNFFPSIDDIASFYGAATSDPKVVLESKRYRKLEIVLRKRLQDVKVFRVGKVEIRCYIAGFVKHGNIAGLVTTAIET